MLRIHTIPAFDDNYFWLFHQQYSNQAYVVDPGDATPVLEALKEHRLELAGIVITHHHEDHVGGVAELLTHVDVPVYGPHNSEFDGITHPLKNGDTVSLANRDFEIIEVPGHTLDHIAYHSAELGVEPPVLFCGDTLFAGGCGRLFEGTPEMMYESLSRLNALAPHTRVYCAHEYTLANLSFAEAVEPDNGNLKQRIFMAKKSREAGEPTVPSTLALEQQTNPFLRSSDPDVANAARQHSGDDNLCEPAQVFAAIRQWKDNF